MAHDYFRALRDVALVINSSLEPREVLHKITEQTAFDRNTLFGTPVREICLEIGFGNGEHLAGQAKNNPQTGYIGAEVFQNGVANLLTLLTGIKVTADLPETVSLEPGRVDNIHEGGRFILEQCPESLAVLLKVAV